MGSEEESKSELVILTLTNISALSLHSIGLHILQTILDEPTQVEARDTSLSTSPKSLPKHAPQHHLVSALQQDTTARHYNNTNGEEKGETSQELSQESSHAQKGGHSIQHCCVEKNYEYLHGEIL